MVDDLTNETTEVTAQPDGSFVARLSNTPVRVHDGSGDWKDVDTDLHVVGTDLEPVAAEGDLSISNGGPAGSTIASYTAPDGASTYAVKSPWPLPTPMVSDQFATYADVLPGIDLVVEATASGFSHNWVIKSAEAAQDPALDDLSLPVITDGLTPRAEAGGTVYDTADGIGGWTPAPVMWDSSGGASTTSVDAVDGGPSDGDAISKVGLRSTDNQLELTPDESLLAADDTSYPVVVDPTYNYWQPYRQSWAAVWDNYPNKSFYGTDHSLGAGYEGFEQNKRVRSYFQFNTSVINSKNVIDAKMWVRQIHAAACGRYETKVYRTNPIYNSTSWSNQPTTHEYQSSNFDDTGCGGSTDTKDVSWSVTAGVTTNVNFGANASTFMVKGDEGNRNGWKQFDDANANLYIRYVGDPQTPGSLRPAVDGATGSCSADAAHPTVLGSTSVSFGAKVWSSDRSTQSPTNLKADFRVVNLGGTNSVESRQTKGVVSSGTSVRLTWDKLLAGGSVNIRDHNDYKVSVRTQLNYDDGVGDSGTLWSHYTTPCYFSIDISRPSTPSLYSPGSSPQELCDKPGSSSDCFSPDLNVQDTLNLVIKQGDDKTPDHYLVLTDTATPSKTLTPTSDGSTPLSILMTDEQVEITVEAVDGAGTESVPAVYIVDATRPTPIAGWSLNDATGTNAINRFKPNGPTLRLGSGTSWTAAGRLGGGLHTGSTATTSSKPVVPTGNYSLSAWVRLDPGASGAVLSVAGTSASALDLSYNSGYWSIGRAINDTSNSSRLTAKSPQPSPSGVWTHVGVVHRTVCGRVSCSRWALYLDGQWMTSFDSTATWPTSAAPLWIGCALGSGAAPCASATVDEVQVYDHSLLITDTVMLSNPLTDDGGFPLSASGQGNVRPAAAWDAGAATGATLVDSTGNGNDLTLVGGAALGQTTSQNQPSSRRVLSLGASSAQASTPLNRVAVDSTGSFTVQASFLITDLTKSGIILRGASGTTDAWVLRYVAGAVDAGGNQTGTVEFRRPTAPGSNQLALGAYITISDVNADDFMTIVASYDSLKNELNLYKDGMDPILSSGYGATGLSFDGIPGSATSQIVVGNGAVSGAAAPLVGEIASAALYDGAVLSATGAQNLSPTSGLGQ